MNALGIGLGHSHAAAQPRIARLPRVPVAAAPVCTRFEKFELDERNARLVEDGRAVELAPRPFAVLCALARQPGTLITKNELLDEVWGHRFVTESVLKTVIAKLRKALRDDARTPRFIETVSRRGYRFIAAGPAPAPRIERLTPERALHEISELLERLLAQVDGAETLRPQLAARIAGRPWVAS